MTAKCTNLALHQAQLFTKVAVDFEELLDFGFGRRESAFHLHELLHCDGAVGEIGGLGALQHKLSR